MVPLSCVWLSEAERLDQLTSQGIELMQNHYAGTSPAIVRTALDLQNAIPENAMQFASVAPKLGH
jgi:hypothetical protein